MRRDRRGRACGEKKQNGERSHRVILSTAHLFAVSGTKQAVRRIARGEQRQRHKLRVVSPATAPARKRWSRSTRWRRNGTPTLCTDAARPHLPAQDEPPRTRACSSDEEDSQHGDPSLNVPLTTNRIATTALSANAIVGVPPSLTTERGGSPSITAHREHNARGHEVIRVDPVIMESHQRARTIDRRALRTTPARRWPEQCSCPRSR